MGAMVTVSARALAHSLLADVLPRRWQHVQGVADRAATICHDLTIDRDAVVAAAWLHDIGYAPKLADSGFHPLDGARYLRREGWSAHICSLVAHHTAARVEAHGRGLVDQLDREFADVPSTERDALWVADATTGPDGRPLTVDERIAEVVSRYGPDHQVSAAIMASRDDLLAAVARIDDQRSWRAAG